MPSAGGKRRDGSTRIFSCLILLSIGLLVAPSAARAWRTTFEGLAGADDQPAALVLGGDGSVVVSGRVQDHSADADHAEWATVKFSAQSGAQLWRRFIVGTGSPIGFDFNFGTAAAIDGNDDVIVAGVTTQFVSHWDVTVAKLAGATGALLWGSVYAWGSTLGDPPEGLFDAARAIGLDQVGNVLVAGSLFNMGTSDDFAMLKFRGADGALLWSQTIAGAGLASADNALAIAVDQNGDAIATGEIDGFAVVKRSGADGQLLWRTDVGGTDPLGAGQGFSVVVAAGGDVIAGGLVANLVTGHDFVVVKLEASTGAELWRATIHGVAPDGPTGDHAASLALDPFGDVVAGGRITDYPLATGFGVVKLAGATGSELWRQVINPADHGYLDEVQALAVDAAGDVLAAGYTTPPGRTDQDITVVKLARESGAEVWRWGFDGTAEEPFPTVDFGASAVAVNASGDVAVAGAFRSKRGGEDWLVALLPRENGGDFPIAGQALRLRDDRLQFSSRDRDILPAAAGHLLGDPTLGGAVLALRNPTTGEAVTVALPAAFWRGTGNPPGARDYAYNDPAPGAPCSRIDVRRGSLRLICTSLGFSLDEPSQGALELTLATGSGGPRYCARFGGVVSEKPGSFLGKNAPRPVSCPVP